MLMMFLISILNSYCSFNRYHQP